MINFVMMLHSHQPVGNFEHVIEEAHAKCYRPFLDVLLDYKDIKFSLHFSGILLDWIERRHPDTFEILQRMTASGQVEMLTGGFYEPILVMLPDRDRMGQIAMQTDYIRKRFGVKPRGFWLAERVWEQSLVSTLADAGVEYVLVDDSHFKFAGFEQESLRASFITEDRGKFVRIFPMDERLRYLIPFHTPEETAQYLRGFSAKDGNFLLTYADDGEKFGTWPGTHNYIYGERWLVRFFEMLRQNASWIRMMTCAEALDRLPPVGRAYLPEASYREMMEWVLPAQAQNRYRDFVGRMVSENLYEQNKVFIKGGTWRSFFAKYPEGAEMYGRMVSVSDRLESRGQRAPASARQELYMAQCNCAYWHGIFGGLYLPHLRFAIYKHLINAESILLYEGRKETRPRIEQLDLNIDGRPETLVSTSRQALAIRPHSGGHVFEWDIRPIAFNACNPLSRRPEAYHRDILNPPAPSHGEVASIHEGIRIKDKDVAQKLIYDAHRRECLVEHFIDPQVTAADFARGKYEERGEFVEADFSIASRVAGAKARIVLSAAARVKLPWAPVDVEMTKTISLDKDRDGYTVAYRLRNLSDQGFQCRFAVEWTFSMLAGNAPDRFYFSPDRPSNLGPLIGELALNAVRRLGIYDGWQKIEISLSSPEPVDIWTFPIQTVSQSEAGVELVYQGSTILLSKTVSLEPRAEEDLSVDAEFRLE